VSILEPAVEEDPSKRRRVDREKRRSIWMRTLRGQQGAAKASGGQLARVGRREGRDPRGGAGAPASSSRYHPDDFGTANMQDSDIPGLGDLGNPMEGPEFSGGDFESIQDETKTVHQDYYKDFGDDFDDADV